MRKKINPSPYANGGIRLGARKSGIYSNRILIHRIGGTVEGVDCIIINWYVHYLHRPLMGVSEMEINNLSPKGLGGCLIFRHLN